MCRFLQYAEGKSEGVSYEHTLAHQDCRAGEKYLRNGPVCHSKGFEESDGGYVLEEHDKKSRDHIETCHDGHQQQDEENVEINQVQPVEDLREP